MTIIPQNNSNPNNQFLAVKKFAKNIDLLIGLLIDYLVSVPFYSFFRGGNGRGGFGGGAGGRF